jgi:hypothetical protein
VSDTDWSWFEPRDQGGRSTVIAPATEAWKPPTLDESPAADAPAREHGSGPSVFRTAWFWVPVSLLVLVVAGYAVHAGTASPSKAADGTTTPTTAPRPTTTTGPTIPTTTAPPAIPPALQSSPDAAAQAFVGRWAVGDRGGATTVATPAAVAALFAAPYPGGGDAQDRGCATSPSPVVCTFGPYGGANPNLPIYSITTVQAPGGWYVGAAQVEG